MNVLAQARDRRAEIVGIAAGLVATQRAGNATVEQEDQLLDLFCERETLDAKIDRLERLADAARGFEVADDATITGGAPRAEQDPNRGFRTYGEFVLAVHAAGQHGATADPRLLIGAAAPTRYSSTIVDSEGGYLVPPGFASTVYDLMTTQDSILPLTDNTPLSNTNNMRFPRDETPEWNSATTGVRTYWTAEKAAITQSNLDLSALDLRLKKCAALLPMTDELLADASAAGSHVEQKTGRALDWAVTDSLINGDGSDRPMGIMNSASTIEVAKETGQTAATIVAENVVNMFSRCINPAGAQWEINPDAWPQLPQLALGNQPMYQAPGGLVAAPAGTLLGLPIRMRDSCQTLGAAGDLILANWSGYNSITKLPALATAVSIHFWFDQDVTAFRATFRVDGHAWLSAAVTPPNSTATRSHFVRLAARA